MNHSVIQPRRAVACAVLLFSLVLQACATHSQLISAESEKSNADAVIEAQRLATNAESRGCKAVSIAGGPSVALGLVIGAGCTDCQPMQQSQRRQVYVVNMLLSCPGAAGVTSK